MLSHKDEVITFKVDAALSEALKGIANRSEFIRQAVLQALKHECPLCHGNGTLTANQMKHWTEFTRTHTVQVCDVCGETHIECPEDEAGVDHGHAGDHGGDTEPGGDSEPDGDAEPGGGSARDGDAEPGLVLERGHVSEHSHPVLHEDGHWSMQGDGIKPGE